MKYAFILIGLMTTFAAWGYKDYSSDHSVHVDSYNRSNGTHVDSYYRSEPGQRSNDVFGDGRARDNF